MIPTRLCIPYAWYLAVIVLYSAPPQAAAADSAIVVYPKRIKIPDDIPSVDTVATSKSDSRQQLRIIPPAIYLKCHYSGWQDSLAVTGARLEGEPGKLHVSNGGLFSRIDPYTDRGYSDGWNACQKEIAKHKHLNTDEIRKICRESIRRLGIVVETDERSQLEQFMSPNGDHPTEKQKGANND